jgi:hypothetical protein
MFGLPNRTRKAIAQELHRVFVIREFGTASLDPPIPSGKIFLNPLAPSQSEADMSDKVLLNPLQSHIETLHAEMNRIQNVATRTIDEECRDELIRIHQSLANVVAVLKVDARICG